MPSNRLEVILSSNVKPFNDGLRQVQREVDKTMGNIVRQAQGATVALGSLAAGGTLLTKSFLDSASQMQQFEATLTAVTGSAAAAKEQLKAMTEFAAKTPFELPSVVEAGVKLKSLGVDVDTFLPLAGNLAAVMGRDIPDAAQALGKAASGSQDGITQLADSFGVTKRELIAAGAAMGEGGAIAVSTAADVDKLQAALQKVVSTKFGGAMDAQSKTLKGAFSNLSDAIGQLKADLGQALAPAAETLARSLTKVVEGLRALPDWVKSTTAFVTVGATAFLAFGAAVSGTVAVFGPVIGQVAALTSKFPVLTTAMNGAGVAGMALGAAFVATTTAVVALGAAAATYITILEQQNKASQALLETELKRTDGLRKHHEMLGKSAEELKKQGATAKDVAELIQGYQEEAEAARNRHDIAGAARASAEIVRLKAIQTQFATTEAGKRTEVAKTKAAEAEAEKRAEQFKKNRTAGVYENSKAELAAMDAVLSGLSKQSALYAELSRERIKLAREVAKEESDASEKGRKDRLEAAKREVDLLGAQSDRNKGKQIAALQDILDNFKLTEDEKGQIEVQMAKLRSDLAEQQKRDDDKAASEKKKKAEEAKKQQEAHHEAVSRLLTAQEQAADAEIRSLEERLGRGEDVQAQLEAEIAKRGELKAKIIEENAAKDKLADPKNAGTLEAAAETAKRAEKKKTADELDRLQRTQAEKRKKEASEESSLAEREAKLREEAEKRVHDAGGKNHGRLVSAMKERQRLEEDSLRAKLEADAAGKSGAELERLQRTYNADLLEMRMRNTEELRKANQELDKAKATTKSMTGQVLSLDEFVKQSNEQFAGGAEADNPEPQAQALRDALQARERIQMSLGATPPPGQPKPGELGYRTSSALDKKEPAQQAGSSLLSGDGIGALISLGERILAAITQGGKSGPMATEHSPWSSTTNRAY